MVEALLITIKLSSPVTTTRNKPRTPTCLSANVVRVRTSVRDSLVNAIVYLPSMGDINTTPPKQPSPKTTIRRI